MALVGSVLLHVLILLTVSFLFSQFVTKQLICYIYIRLN
jgi:hypothetical protein